MLATILVPTVAMADRLDGLHRCTVTNTSLAKYVDNQFVNQPVAQSPDTYEIFIYRDQHGFEAKFTQSPNEGFRDCTWYGTKVISTPTSTQSIGFNCAEAGNPITVSNFLRTNSRSFLSISTVWPALQVMFREASCERL